MTLATTGEEAHDLDELADDGTLAPTSSVWLFGSEAHGLPERGAPDVPPTTTVRVPIHGAAESLNLAAAAAVCFYAERPRPASSCRVEPGPR